MTSSKIIQLVRASARTGMPVFLVGLHVAPYCLINEFKEIAVLFGGVFSKAMPTPGVAD